MTPQTAAALRALVSDFHERAKEPIQDSIAYLAYNYCADQLAAVLTQEGADDAPWKQAVLTQCMIYEGGWCESDPERTMRQLLDIVAGLQAAPAEPRAAEGAGTDDLDRRADALTKGWTAAAAVPAGGDAVADGWWTAAMRSYEVPEGSIAAITRTAHELSDSRAPAPRGGVTEAMDVIRQAMRDQPDFAWSWHSNVAMAAVAAGASHRDANEKAAQFMRNAFDVDVRATEFWKDLFDTPPAAQAQNAGPNGNYVCDKEVFPTSVTFTDGRIVRLAHDADYGYYLEVERENAQRS